MLEHPPEKLSVTFSLEFTSKVGVELLPGVEIGVTISRTGSIESIVNSARFRGKL